MAAHRVVAAGAERGFHARARIAAVGAFQHAPRRCGNGGPSARSAECRRRPRCGAAVAGAQSIVSGQRRDRGQVFGLDQRDAALAAAAGVAVADQALAGDALRRRRLRAIATSRAGRRPIHSHAPARGNWPSGGRVRSRGRDGSVTAAHARRMLASRPWCPCLRRMPSRCVIEPLPYEARLDARPAVAGRPGGDPLHRTARPGDGARIRRARARTTGRGTGNSGHYYIDRDGDVHRYVRARPRRPPHARLQPALDRHRTGQHAGVIRDWLDSRPPGDGRAVSPRRRSTRWSRCSLRLQRELPALRFIAGHEDLDTGHGAPPTTIRRRQVRAQARSRDRCSRGTRDARRCALERLRASEAGTGARL